jgi:hypothetical protein
LFILFFVANAGTTLFTHGPRVAAVTLFARGTVRPGCCGATLLIRGGYCSGGTLFARGCGSID